MGDGVILAADCFTCTDRLTHSRKRYGPVWDVVEPMREEVGKREIAGVSRLPFVGRKREFSELQQALDAGLAGSGGLVMIEGESGIGKSRLATEFTTVAQKRGAKVLWGRCDGGVIGVPLLWPWIQIAQEQRYGGELAEPGPRGNGHLSKRAEDTWPSDGASSGPGLGPDNALAVRSDFETIIDATLNTLSKVARSVPLVVIVDDVHRADPQSLEALGIVARELCGTGLLIIASYWDRAIRSASSVAERFTSVASIRSHCIRLSGFDEDELVELVELRTGRKPEPSLVQRLKRMTGGNPRFIRLLLDQELTVPARHEHKTGVRMTNVLRAAAECHLEPLPESLRAALTMAAVAGPEFEVAVLRQVCDRDWERTLGAIDQAESAGLIFRIEGIPGRYRFVHTLVRDALCEALPALERAAFHKRIAEALTRLHPFDDEYLGDIAVHFFEGALSRGAGTKAIEHCKRAAERANALGRFGEASRFFEMALTALDLLGCRLETKRCDLLLALGKTQRADGRASEALQTFMCAAEWAERTGDPNRLARVALAMAGDIWTAAVGSFRSPQVKALLERSLHALGSSASALKAMVSVRLAAELCDRTQDEKRRRSLLKQAVRIANRSGDAEARLAIFHYRHLILLSRSDRVDERLADAEEMQSTAAAAGSDEDWCKAFAFRSADLLRKGEVVRADAEAAMVSHAAKATRKALFETTATGYGAVRAFIDGRFEEGERSAWHFLRFVQASYPEAVASFLPSVIVPFRELDRLGEIAEFAAQHVQKQPWLLLLRAGLAQIRLGLGDTEGARLLFDALAVHGFGGLADNISLGAYLATLAELCAELGDRERAVKLYELLLPYSGFNIVFSHLGFFGPASRYLGVLATMLGRFAEAESHLMSALRLSSRTGARPWIAYTEYDYGQMLLARDRAGDRQMALWASKAALNTAQTLGMKDLARRASLLKTRAGSENTEAESATHSVQIEQTRRMSQLLQISGESGRALVAGGDRLTASSLPAELAESKAEACIQAPHTEKKLLKREGDYWTIVFEARVLRLRHYKGLGIISWLLRYPGQQFLASVLESLASGGHPAEVERNPGLDKRTLWTSTVPVGGSGPVLDAAARSSYVNRLKELRDELEEAKSFNDLGRVPKIKEEMDFLTRELAHAVGLRGHDRKWASEAERSRVNVTNAVRSVINRVRPEHPSLARYLATTIKTGRFCAFNPDPNYPEAWSA